MNSLKRQASKAERYAKLRDEMRAKLRVVLASKFAQLDSEAASLESQLAALSEEMQTKLDAAQQMESEHSALTQRGYAIERDAQANREQLNSLAMELDRASARRRTNEGVVPNSMPARRERRPRSQPTKSSTHNLSRNCKRTAPP